MKLYRVIFTTEMMVECEDERDAERIGYRCLIDEVRNGGSTTTYRVEEVRSVDELRRGERGSLPWRDSRRYGEPEVRVEELLKEC